MPNRPRTLPGKEEMVNESNNPKRASQMRMQRPTEDVTWKGNFSEEVRAEARFQRSE